MAGLRRRSPPAQPPALVEAVKPHPIVYVVLVSLLMWSGILWMAHEIMLRVVEALHLP